MSQAPLHLLDLPPEVAGMIGENLSPPSRAVMRQVGLEIPRTKFIRDELTRKYQFKGGAEPVQYSALVKLDEVLNKQAPLKVSVIEGLNTMESEDRERILWLLLSYLEENPGDVTDEISDAMLSQLFLKEGALPTDLESKLLAKFVEDRPDAHIKVNIHFFSPWLGKLKLDGLGLLPPFIGQAETVVSQLSEETRRKLRYLWMDELNLTVFPQRMEELVNLRVLTLNNNQLRNYTNFHPAPTLTHLELANNQLAELPPNHLELMQLARFDMRANLLTVLDYSIFYHPKLHTLNLSHNNFGDRYVDYNGEIRRSPGIAWYDYQPSDIDLSYCNLRSIPAPLYKVFLSTESIYREPYIAYLHSLNLSHNFISEAKIYAIARTNLSNFIDLSYNRLSKIEFPQEKLPLQRSFQYAGSIGQLDLSHNRLHSFFQSSNAPIIKYFLDLSYNPLSYFEAQRQTATEGEQTKLTQLEMVNKGSLLKVNLDHTLTSISTTN